MDDETQTESHDPSRVRPLALVVEDDDKAATLMRLHLEHYGFRVARAGTAERALETAAAEKPDLITLDVMLPGMSGIECLARIKSDPKLADVPVLVISMIGGASMSGIATGATRVLHKPVRHEELGKALRAAGFNPVEERMASVLLVNDDPIEMQLLDGYLDGAGHQVLRAYDGQEGIEMARRFHPDLIVFKQAMPRVNGFEMAETLGGDPGTMAIPMLALASAPLSGKDRAMLTAHRVKIMEVSDFSHPRFLSEVKQALAGAG